MKKVSFLVAFAVMMGVSGAAFAQEQAPAMTEAAAPAATAAAEQKSESALKVSESAVCTAISDRMPEGTAAEFAKDTPKIYYWTKIEGADGAVDVKHVWYAGETVIGEVPLKITTPSFRTWSSKTVYPGLEGDLSVAVVDAAGNVLKKDTFKIK